MEGFCNQVPRPKFLANGLDYEFFRNPIPRPKFLTNGLDHGALPGWIRIPGSRPRSKKKPLSFKIPFKTDKFFAEARSLVFGRLGFFDFLLQSSPSAKISGQRTGLRFFSQSSPSAKIFDQRIRPRGTSQLDPDSGFPAAIEKKAVVF